MMRAQHVRSVTTVILKPAAEIIANALSTEQMKRHRLLFGRYGKNRGEQDKGKGFDLWGQVIAEEERVALQPSADDKGEGAASLSPVFPTDFDEWRFL